MIAVVLAGLIPTLGWAQDQDGDGALDAADVYPCDASAAGEVFAPAEGSYGTLLFEDEWPMTGDQDLNDLVLDYNYRVTTDVQGRAVSVTATYHVAAVGGVNPTGFGVQFPFPASAVAAASIQDVDGTRGLVPVANDVLATFRVAPDLGALFSGVTPPFNVQLGGPSASGQTIVVQVDLVAPTALAMSEAPFDVFLFHVADPARETHLPRYAGTARMNAALFGTGQDGSGGGRNFVDTSGVPFVLDVPQSSDYPLELTHVAQLWPNINSFASSGGATHQDFYTASQDSFRFTGRAGPPAVTQSTPDTSCVPSGHYPDPFSFNRLLHVATHGSDASGDGSSGNPFASLHVAVAPAADGDGIQIHPGTYRTVPQVHYPGYMVAGIYDAGKQLHIFGANDQTVLEVVAADSSYRDHHVVSFKAASILSNLVVHFSPNRSTNYSNAIMGWSTNGAEIHNVVFENTSTTHNWAYIYDNYNPYDTPRVFNSVFVSNGRWQTRYTGRPSFINCLMEDAPRYYSLLSNNVYRRATVADLGAGAVTADLANAGDPAIVNPDGSRSHIGVRGGRFAWP